MKEVTRKMQNVCLNKILERCMQRRIITFLEQNNYFYMGQHGFRKKQSTITAVVDTVHNLSMHIDKGKATGLLLLDFKKAFDSIDHNRLLGNIESVGTKGFPKEWVKSYLEDKYQYVHFKGHSSTHRLVVSGVPQGLVLSYYTLFITYISDIATL